MRTLYTQLRIFTSDMLSKKKAKCYHICKERRREYTCIFAFICSNYLWGLHAENVGVLYEGKQGAWGTGVEQ